jgi:hypothetical protein
MTRQSVTFAINPAVAGTPPGPHSGGKHARLAIAAGQTTRVDTGTSSAA